MLGSLCCAKFKLDATNNFNLSVVIPIGVGYAVIEAVVGCDWVRHEGGPGVAKKQNQAAGAHFWQTKCGGAFFWVEGTILGRICWI